MCVRIARDVLVQLRLGRYVAQQGVYVEVNTPQDGRIDYDTYTDINLNQSFQKFFKQNKEATCEVCALGSAFASLVNIENKCSIVQIQDPENLFVRLSKYFGNENIVLMESAFECDKLNNINHRSDESFYIDDDLLGLAAEWGKRYIDDTQRLRAIMFNVIRNNGDFKLPKKMLARRAAVSVASSNGW